MDFYAPQLNLGATQQGIDANQSLLLNPLALARSRQAVALGGQQVESGQLNLEQLRRSMGFMGQVYDAATQELQARNSPQPGPTGGVGGAQAQGGVTGGIQNGPQANYPQDSNSSYGADGVPSIPRPMLSSGTVQALSLIDPKMAEGLAKGQDYFRAQREDAINRLVQQRLQPAVDQIDNVVTSPAPERLLMNNAGYMQAWQANARRLGIDGSDPAQMTPENVRAVATLVHNDIAAQSYGKIAPKPMPNTPILVRGANGQLLSRDPVTGEVKEIVGQKMPGYSLEKTGFDPNTGRESGQMVQTSPGGAPAPAAVFGGQQGRGGPQGGGAGGVGTAVGSPIDLGMPKPGPEAPRMAAFAQTMRDSLTTIRGLESQGIALTPTQRTQVIKIATDEGGGALSQWAQQEALKRNLGPQAQTYLAAMMPVIQAVSHDQGGARLNQSQIRTNLESVIPVDVNNGPALAQINKTRTTFYQSMALGAGAYGRSNMFPGVRTDLDAAAGTSKTVNGKSYTQRGGKWYAD